MPDVLATKMPCDTFLHNDTFRMSSFANEKSPFFIILYFLEMAFLGSLPKMLGAKAQQSPSVDILVLDYYYYYYYYYYYSHDTGYSQAVTHPSTNPARPGLTSADDRWRVENLENVV